MAYSSSDRVIVPTSLGQCIIQKIHNSHMGIEGSQRRAREAYYWPLMNAEIRDHAKSFYVVTIDYYSNFIEMDQLTETTSHATIKALMKQFSRHGIPDVLISDNGPQYSSDEFRQFAHQWEFKHITSSPEQR